MEPIMIIVTKYAIYNLFLFIRFIYHIYTVYQSIKGIKKGTKSSSFFTTIDFHYIYKAKKLIQY